MHTDPFRFHCMDCTRVLRTHSIGQSPGTADCIRSAAFVEELPILDCRTAQRAPTRPDV